MVSITPIVLILETLLLVAETGKQLGCRQEMHRYRGMVAVIQPDYAVVI